MSVELGAAMLCHNALTIGASPSELIEFHSIQGQVIKLEPVGGRSPGDGRQGSMKGRMAAAI